MVFTDKDYLIFIDDDKMSEDSNIFRYFDLPGILDLIYNTRILLTRTDKFEDKFEGNFTQYIYKGIKYIWMKKEGQRHGFEYLFKKECERIKNHSYVSSWSLADKENMALWKLFGKENNSIAIKTSVGNLKESLQNGIKSKDGALFSLMRKRIVKIEYIDHAKHNDYKNFLSQKDNTYILKVKSLGYRFEEEVRVIFDAVEIGREAIATRLGEKCFVVIDPSHLIQELVVSPLADEWFYELVGKLIPDFKIIWSELKFTPYEKISTDSIQ